MPWTFASLSFMGDQPALENLEEQEQQVVALSLAKRSCASSSGNGSLRDVQPANLLELPTEIVSIVITQLEDLPDLARLAATCHMLWCDAPAAAEWQIGPVELELRQRAEARRLVIDSSLPEGAASWVSYLLKRELRDALRRQAPLAAGSQHSVFVDRKGRLLTCGKTGSVLGQGSEPNAIGPPTLVPSMLDRRVVSVASGNLHCLALGAEGEVYSWGDGRGGGLGHGDENLRAVPSRIASLGRIESIMAGNMRSAAVDERGRLFTWGLARIIPEEDTWSTGLGYAVDLQTQSQLTPRRVDALSQDRVVAVALGLFFTLAVTDAGVVFSCGSGPLGVLGHGSMESEMLPRQIEALTQTGRRFVAVAAGDCHALALTEEGQLYGWGWGGANGHGQGGKHDTHTPELLTALLGERVTCVDAAALSSCAVTETGELYTWGAGSRLLSHGGVAESLAVPKRVERLSGVRFVGVALGGHHILVADEDGGAWACGGATEACTARSWQRSGVQVPTLIPTLRMRSCYR